MSNIFEEASRFKLRFATPKGDLTVEDLWSLPLTSNTGKVNIDDITRDVYTRLQATKATVSFVEQTAVDTASQIEQLRFDILKHIIEVKKAENSAALAARERAETKARIRELIANKQDEALAGKSIDELTALLGTL